MGFSPDQLFDLVADIERYPDFLPWCVGARIKSRQAQTISADLIIGFNFKAMITTWALNPWSLGTETKQGDRLGIETRAAFPKHQHPSGLSQLHTSRSTCTKIQGQLRDEPLKPIAVTN